MENVEDVLNVGDKVQVELAEIDQRGKLSLHAVLTDEQLAAEEEAKASRGGEEEGERRERRPRRSERGEEGERRARRPRRRRNRAAEESSPQE